MKHVELFTSVAYIVRRSNKLKNRFTRETAVPVEFACVFCQSEEEYQGFTRVIEVIGEIVERTPSGYTYLLREPIATAAGPLRLVKVRKPDPKLKLRGDADFNTDYEAFKKRYGGNPKFELVKRPTFEMLRLSDPAFDVMACFSGIPKSKELGINLKNL